MEAHTERKGARTERTDAAEQKPAGTGRKRTNGEVGQTSGASSNSPSSGGRRGGDWVTARQEQAAMKKLKAQGRAEGVALWQFLVNTGLRVSEALAVRVEDIERGRATVTGKGGAERTVYFRVQLARDMRRYLLERTLRKDQDPRLLFPFSRYTAYRLLKCTGWYPHALRHTFLTRKMRDTNNIKLVQTLAGHKSIRTTADVYLHFTEEEIEAAYTSANTWWAKLRRLVARARSVVERSARPPERTLKPSPIHAAFAVYGQKGAGKSHVIRNTWPGAHHVEYTTKGKTTKAIEALVEAGELSDERPLWVEWDHPTPSKMRYAEKLAERPDIPVVIVEFRKRKELDERKILTTLFEFQPLKVKPFSLREARQYLRHLCATSAARYRDVKKLVDISTNPLFLRESLFRERKEILMSATPVTLGPLFLCLGIMFMISRYAMIGGAAYALAAGGYIIFRLLSRW